MTTIVEYASIPNAVTSALLDQDASPQVPRLRSRDVQRTQRELRMGTAPEGDTADNYVAASRFSAQCLEAVGVPSERIRVIPLGVDLARFFYSPRDAKGPLRVLFVGKVARHKGVHYLLEAVKSLASADITLSLVGPSVGDESFLDPFRSLFRTLGPLEGDALVRAFHDHDVLVVPSLYEGFGLVIVEAMASGMPVIATENSCAPDVVRQGMDGFVVGVRDAEAIAERLDWFATNRAQLDQMGQNAASRASEYSWERYDQRVREFILGVLANGPKS